MCTTEDETPEQRVVAVLDSTSSSSSMQQLELESPEPLAVAERNPFAVIYGQCLEQPADGRTILFSRHGESEYNVQDRIGGNPDLTEMGQTFARAIGQYVNGLGTKIVY